LKAALIEENRKAQSRNAVVFCCDNAYLPYAALAVHSLVRANPSPSFDICIVSLDVLPMQPAIAHADVRNCRIDVGTVFDAFPTSERFSIAAYMRLVLPEVFENDYDRILYLDCDVLVTGTQIASAFDLDLKGAPVGAVTDGFQWKKPGQKTADQVAIGFDGAYFNSGVLLIDNAAYLAQNIKEKCVAAAIKYPSSDIYFDQTLLNFVLQGNWARMNPAWNWQWAVVRPMYGIYLNLQIVHFVTQQKPWNDRKGNLPVLYRDQACSFLSANYPELPITIIPPRAKLLKRQLLVTFLKHLARMPRFVRAFNANGGDIHRVVAPDDPDY
jgi:lipopolysaccharide biosynthesis glycosyltransferase